MDCLIKFNGKNYVGVIKKEKTVIERNLTFNESTTFTVPEGVTSITVEVAGAGGGGSGFYEERGGGG